VQLQHEFSFGAPMSLDYRWDSRTYVDLSQLDIRDQLTGRRANFLAAYDNVTNSLHVRFDYRNGVLPNGNYVATLPAAAVTDLAGNAVFADSVTSFQVLAGDADHNGVIDFNDYAIIDFGFNTHLSGWNNGDFDGNGLIDFDDYAIIDFAFNEQTSARLPTPVAAKGPQLAAPRLGRWLR
jgi:hypothetical protein